MERQRSFRRRMLQVAGWLCLALAVLITACFVTVPTRNTDVQHFDTILILGTPAEKDGTPTKQGRWLVTEGVHEYKAGKADHIVISGAAVANKFVEADVLARMAVQMGMPASAVLEDRQARDTKQNVENTASLMHQNGWTSVEVVGLPEHLHRTAVLLGHTSLQWSVHPAATPGRSVSSIALRTVIEAIGTTVLRVFGLEAVPVLHRFKTMVWHTRN